MKIESASVTETAKSGGIKSKPAIAVSGKETGLNIRRIAKQYPIPVFAIVALVAGAIVEFGFNASAIARWVWYGALVIGGVPIVWKTVRGMVKGKFASDVVAMLAIVAAILMDQAFAGVVVVIMQSGGEAIEDYGLRRASSSLDALLARAPKLARRKKADGTIETIGVSEVKVGDIMVVRPGDLVPVDGEVVSGHSEVDESALTGEPIPKSKSVGDKILSGCINLNGGLEMKASSPSSQSEYAKIVELVEKAQQVKPPIQRLADHYAVYFTPITLAVSFLGFLITLNPVTVLAVLVVATPCPLILATPIAVISGVNRAAKRGIIVKGGAAIEQIGRAKAVAFDKTGTITFGTPLVEKIVTVDSFSSEEILFIAGSLGQLSSHVASQAIARKAMQQFHNLETPSNFKETPGAGVSGIVQGKEVLIGSKRYLENSLGIETVGAAFNAVIDAAHSLRARLVTFIAIENQPAGAVIFNDQIRAGVPAMIQRLRELGVEETVMLTGDNAENAEAISKEAGIQDFKSDLLPGQKVEALQGLKQKYDPLIMVGDGINDAPALATATVGVAMGAHGSAISAETADVVLLVDDISIVGDAVFIGQRMLKIAKQGIFIGLGLSSALMIIAAFGFIPPAFGAMLQEVIDASVVMNALRAR